MIKTGLAGILLLFCCCSAAQNLTPAATDVAGHKTASDKTESADTQRQTQPTENQPQPNQAEAKQPCVLVAHLNESKENSAEQGLSLPRWYDLHARLLHLLTDAAGCQLTLVGSPWPRSLALLQQGKIDLMLTMSYTPERAEYADFIGVHYLEESVLVLHKDVLNLVHQLSDIRLLPGSIGVLRDAYYGEAFEQLRHEVSYQPFLQYANTLTQKLNMLKKGRVLGMIEDKTQYMEWSQIYPELKASYRLSLTLNKAPVYIVASKKGVSPALRQRLHRAWQQVYGKEQHLAILAEFGWELE